jgi:hypothetical protein
LFLTVILLAQTPLQQLLRLPVLVQHFQEHRTETPGISLSSFLILHYFSGHPKDADYDRDMQLPFRAQDVVLISSTVVPEPVEIDFAPPVGEPKPYPLLHVKALLPIYPFDIFQPPRTC